MSVLIKDMEMPDNCDVCWFSAWDHLHQTACCKLKKHQAVFHDYSTEYREKRSDMCPLFEASELCGDAEFWRGRADYYYNMCSKLIADMGAGVKIEAVKIDETGITFTKKKPSTQPEIIHCRDCRYSTDFYQDGCCYCKRPSEEMRYIEEGYGFYCAGAERRTDGRD